MSITDSEQIDGAGIDNSNSNRLNLMIADNLDWEYPSIHLEILTDKLNNYYHYIKSGQYLNKWQDVSEFNIIIYFKNNLIEEAQNYLEEVSRIIMNDDIFIEVVIDKN